ncbi:hypothetical protein [Methylotenera sp.]|uniref:hypothetical protein n=1 Tax=Methylotenera sp. TaxID=2051956 RepID=UPI0024899C4A|nr:hypothetical protein [Methylotenera sp.]MDI1298666.1 hypothetical protein [Methylotenera sp.]
MTKLSVLALMLALTGCMTIEGMNTDLARIDQVWDAENMAAIGQRSHVVNVDYKSTFKAVEQTLADLHMPILKSSIEKGFITSKNEAPTPLTMKQWKQVVELENPRISDVGGWMYSLPDNPEGQFVNTKVAIEASGNQTKITLNYFINIPQYDDMGLITPKNVAPIAEKLACEVFWKQLDKNISNAK